ncbi:hypothetical protein CAEBREN_31279 [Caenorhabditis brenneri]|uniref:Transmembrane protein n=1 Tax=Caenorhabditis brenneri TaxID=135651 RepID=G0PBM7_CAEBE|nr:hypothetical protein CAEBREN_31279 [Caenorhabditis brenneri]
MSDRSLSSQQKSVTKGLSPPKETRSSDKKSSGRRNKSPSKSKKSSIESKPPEGSDHEIDATQWEFSRFKEEAGGTVNEDPNVYVKEQVGEGTPFLAEKKQKMLIRGEHLKQKPMYTLFFLFIQMIFALTVLITWSYFLEYNGVIPIILCYTNTIIILIVLLIVFVIQFARFNVVKEELDDDIRFRIPYDWKYWICVLHLLTFFLTCSNITIGALDNDFDGGAIAVVSGMPVLLILSAGHIFFALRPQG